MTQAGPAGGGKVLREPLILGWREWVALPDLGIDAIKAKVDTGARTSSLHAVIDRRYVRDDGVPMVSFLIEDGSGNPRRIEAEVADERDVRSSNGDVETRLFIRTRLVLGGRRWRTEISLASRATMGFEMLLGRRSLRGKALVDPRRSFVLGGAVELPPQRSGT